MTYTTLRAGEMKKLLVATYGDRIMSVKRTKDFFFVEVAVGNLATDAEADALLAAVRASGQTLCSRWVTRTKPRGMTEETFNRCRP